MTLREVSSGRETVLTPRLAFIDRVRWSPDGGALLLSGADVQGRSGLFVTDRATGRTRQAVVERTGEFRGLAGDWSADGRRIYFAQRSGADRFAIRSLELESGRTRHLFEPPPGHGIIRSLRRARGGDRLAFVLASGPDGRTQSVQVLDPESGRSITVLHANYGSISSVEWIAADENLLVSAEAGGQPSLWAVPSRGGNAARLDAAWKRPGPVRVSPDGKALAFSAGETQTEVWALENLPPPRRDEAGASLADRPTR